MQNERTNYEHSESARRCIAMIEKYAPILMRTGNYLSMDDTRKRRTRIEYWGENEEEKLAKKAKILEMRSQGMKIVRIAEALNIHSGSVVYVINKQKKEQENERIAALV
jgi:hypothetical protein